MTLAPEVVRDCLGAVQLNGTQAVVIPEISIGDGFLAACRRSNVAATLGRLGRITRFFSRGLLINRRSMSIWRYGRPGPHDQNCCRRPPASNRSYITHDEGRLRLATLLAKKRYYTASSFEYWRKHGLPSLGQANLVFRPAFLRNWRRFVRHPVLSLGVSQSKP